MSLSAHLVIHRGAGPIVAAAIHNGHELSDDVARVIRLDEAERLREEDPYTAGWTQVASTQVIGLRSRFEVDLNRPRDHAVYRRPEEAWGLDVWNEPLEPDLVRRSLSLYDGFYRTCSEVLTRLIERYGRVVVYDIHSYNHLRNGPASPPADAEQNPEINIGTGTMDRQYWSPVVDRFLSDLRAFNLNGRHLDVRENVKFQGGNFVRWIHQQFPRQVCGIAIEFKKVFMNEWTGACDFVAVDQLFRALQSTVPGIEETLNRS